MKNKLKMLIKRREHLLAIVDVQRTLLLHNLEPWRARLAVADHGIAAVHYIKRYSILPIGSALFITALHQKSSGQFLRRLWLAWLLGRTLFRK